MTRSVSEWLKDLGLGKYVQVFVEQDIDFDVLPELSDSDLQQLGLSLGHRRKVLKALKQTEANEDSLKIDQSSAEHSEAERRQLTIMFCDLVGSTELSARLEVEDVRDVLHAYQNTVAGNISRFDGHVAKFMGDGVLAYFGYPKAHEDDAERAVRAGLSILETMRQLTTPSGERLKVRIGVATGLVVVGDVIGFGAAQEEAVVGDTPNLAARLQTEAKPGEILISSATRGLLGDAFAFEELGEKTIKGFRERQKVYAVKGERVIESRYRARHSNLREIIGRDHELALLLDRWKLAKNGEGQGILLTGEAGIGKSHLTQALIEAMATDEHIRIGLQCSPFHIDSPMWPIIQYFRRRIGFRPEITPTERPAELDHILQSDCAASLDGETVNQIAELVGLHEDQRKQSSDMLPQQLRARTLDALADYFLKAAETKPMLIVVEDAHWIDPSTLELLEHCLARLMKCPIMILLTSRPEGQPNFRLNGRLVHLTLSQMSRSSLKRLVHSLAGQRLSESTVDKIIQRTDGIPLFAEEVTKTVLETGETGIPTSLYDSLMARLDRNSGAKKIVQAASCIGRDFDQKLLTAVVEVPNGTLFNALDSLVEAGVLLPVGGASSGSFTFKHALVRNVAYDSMLRKERKACHRQIAAALSNPTVAQELAEPEVIAFHFEQAEQFEPASQNWFRACRASVDQSADREAIAHAENALRCLQNVEPSTRRDQMELETLMSYGTALLSSRGWAVKEIANVYERVAELAERLGNVPDQFAASWNLWLFNMQRGNINKAHNLVDLVLSSSKKLEDDEAELQAHHAAWTTLFNFAPLKTVQEHLDRGLSLYDQKRHRHSWARYGGHDPCVCGHGHASWLAWFGGASDTALVLAEGTIAAAKNAGHAYSELLSWFFLSSVHYYRRDPRNVFQCSSTGMELANSLGLAQHNAVSKIFRGWAVSEFVSPEEGLDEILQGISQLDELKVGLRRTLYLIIAAEACLKAERPGEAQKYLELAKQHSKKNKESRWLPELARLEVAAARQDKTLEWPEAAALLQKSISSARQGGALIYELRSTIDLACGLRDQGEKGLAMDLLQPLVSKLKEGLDTPDLVKAKIILRDLQ